MSRQSSQISKVQIDKLHPEKVWDLVMDDKIKWLQQFYQKTKVQNTNQTLEKKQQEKKNQTLEKIKESIEGLKKKIAGSKFNEDSKYSKSFKQIQKDKYFQKLVKSNTIQVEIIRRNISHNQSVFQSYLQLTNMEEYQLVLLKNHKQIIKLLTNERFSFHNIAQHIHQQKADTQTSFFFFVQRGRPVQHEKELNIIFLFILVRDLIKAIRELQKFKIAHLDLGLQNILLFSSHPSLNFKQLIQLDLNSQEKLADQIDKIKFKLIDFGNSMAFRQQFIKNNKQVMKKRVEINGKILYVKKDIFTKQFQNDKQICQLIQETSKSQQIDGKINQMHKKGFVECVKQILDIIKPPQIQRKKWGQKILYYSKMLSNQQQQIISTMEKTIKAFKQNKNNKNK